MQGERADAEQRRNIARAHRIAAEEKAGPRATLALHQALIVESWCRNLKGGEGSSSGPLQVTAETASRLGIDPRDFDRVVREFLRNGFAKHRPKGAIELAREHKDWTSGQIAQACQGSAHPRKYDQYRREAEKIVEAAGGVGSAPGSGDTAYVKPYEFRRNRGEDSWEALRRLAEEVGWRCFAVAGVVYFASDFTLIAAQPYMSVREGDSDDAATGVDRILWTWSRGLEIDEMSVTARLTRWGAPPGSVVSVRGEGPANGPWLVRSVRRELLSPTGAAEITLGQPVAPKAEPAPEIVRVSRPSRRGDPAVTTSGGARGIVESAVRVAKEAGGEGVFVVSAHRPNEPGDHNSNDADKAARDIGVRGINALTGPPSPKLDDAVVAIGKEFGRDYGSGRSGRFQNADTFRWRGYRIQIIWRTDRWGGHLGHIHIGARRL